MQGIKAVTCISRMPNLPLSLPTGLKEKAALGGGGGGDYCFTDNSKKGREIHLRSLLQIHLTLSMRLFLGAQDCGCQSMMSIMIKASQQDRGREKLSS